MCYRTMRWILTALAMVGLLAISGPAQAGPLGRAVARSATRSAKGGISSGLKGAFNRDASGDAKLGLKRLPRAGTAFKYTDAKTAASYLRRGIPGKTHMTSHASPGRPLSAARAARAEGIPRPEKRLTIALKKGTGVKFGKVIRRKPGQRRARLWPSKDSPERHQARRAAALRRPNESHHPASGLGFLSDGAHRGRAPRR
jgi:hypothetical protein